MKRLLILLLCFVLMFVFIACQPPTPDNGGNGGNGGNTDGGNGNGGGDEDPFKNLAVMSYEEYMAAEVDAPVHVQVYVQDHQSWWDNKITVYAADEDGGYFIYDMACSEEDAAKLVPGTKIAVKGYKAIWSGEVEIMDSTFEFVEGEYDPYIADAVDLTDVLGTDELIDYQNQLAQFDGLTVKNISFKGEGDDIYLTLTKDGNDYAFCVEKYLTGPDTEVYQRAAALQVGEIVNVTGFVYWYEDAINTHVTGVTKAGVLSYDEYVAAELDQFVVIEAYVQAHQSWWFDSDVNQGRITVYAADENGAYFLYEMFCSEEDAAKLVAGAKIRAYGYKGAWAGEVEIMDATFEFVEADPFIAEAKDLTDKLGTEELINYQNQLATFKGLTVSKVEFKNDGGDDIYVDFTYGGETYSFCVEKYLTGTESEVYLTVSALEVGDVVDVTGFVYWYNGINTHITGVEIK